MADPFVVIAATPRGWATALHAHAADHGGVVVRSTVLTAADARDERADVLLVDDITSFLTPALVAAVHQRGRAVLGVHEVDDAAGIARLLDAGVDAVLPASSDPAAMVAAIQALATSRPSGDGGVHGTGGARGGGGARRDGHAILGAAPDGPVPLETVPAGTAPPGPAGGTRGALAPDRQPTLRRRPRDGRGRRPGAQAPAGARRGRTATSVVPTTRVIGVTGPPGGVGVTEVAIEIAAILGGCGLPTVLVDADEAAPSHAQRLRLALQPNMLGALDAARRGGDLAAGLHPLSRRHPLAALPGMTVAEDWCSVPRGSLEALVGGLADQHARVVVDLGHCPPAVEGGTGPRFGHAAELATRCTDIVVVTAPTPTAIARTIALRSTLPAPATTFRPLLNRDTGDRYVRRECVAELTRSLGVDAVPVVGEDAQVPRAAWQGERVPRGRFCRQVAAAVDAWGWR